MALNSNAVQENLPKPFLNSPLVRNTKRYFQHNAGLLLLMLPGIVHIFLIQYMAMFGAIIAFKDYRAADGIFGSKWTGFQNFRFLFQTDIAWRVTFNTVYMNALFIATGTIVALFLAILLNEIYGTKLSQIYQLTLFIPFFIGPVIIGYIAYAILNTDGFINAMLRANGYEMVSFYAHAEYWRSILIIANLWGGVGFGTIIYLSGMIGISPEYYEAAHLDGANKLQQIFFITIPMIKYLIVVQLLLAVGRIFFANFGLFYFVPQLYKNGNLIEVADVLDTFVYRALYGGGVSLGSGGRIKLGMAAAAGLYQSFVGLILVFLANLGVRRFSREHALF
ncbi:MAG: sugar ABC transporter permease [Anaerolineales bacterium]|nr:MAG: sugar ABC transporter permease [Anaerolineales bacterium]